MQLRFAGSVFVPLLVAACVLPVAAQDAGAAATPEAAAQRAPREAIVTGARDPLYTLGIGTNDGAQAGAIYGVTGANGTP